MKRLLTLLFLSSLAWGQQSSLKPAGAGADGANGNTVWTNPGNITVEDGVLANANGIIATSISNELKATQFGFAIPGGGTIVGVQVDIKKKAGTANTIVDNDVTLLKAGTAGGTSQGDTVTNWSTTLGFVTYGSSSNLWGFTSSTLTPTDVNNTNFGVQISATNNDAVTNRNASVDFIRMTVFFTSSSSNFLIMYSQTRQAGTAQSTSN